LGDDARPLAKFGKLRKLGAAPSFSIVESTLVGADVRLRLRPDRKS
jgi:riboflavin biosynthesis pyrimidine reductase